MTVTFYLEIIDGDKHTWVNHSVTKVEEIEWLLAQVKETLHKAFVNKGNPMKSGLFKSLFGKSNQEQVWPDKQAENIRKDFRNRMGEL